MEIWIYFCAQKSISEKKGSYCTIFITRIRIAQNEFELQVFRNPHLPLDIIFSNSFFFQTFYFKRYNGSAPIFNVHLIHASTIPRLYHLFIPKKFHVVMITSLSSPTRALLHQRRLLKPYTSPSRLHIKRYHLHKSLWLPRLRLPRLVGCHGRLQRKFAAIATESYHSDLTLHFLIFQTRWYNYHDQPSQKTHNLIFLT